VRAACQGDNVAEEQDPYVVLSSNAESFIFESGEPSDFIYETSGDLLAVNDADDRSLVGKFRLYYIDVGRAINHGTSVFDVFDSYAHTLGYYDALFDPNSSEFSGSLMNILEYDVFDSNVLILDRLEILPKYRGRGLGLSVMRHMIERFAGGAAVVAIKPFPLQLEPDPSDENEKRWRVDLGLPTLSKNKRNTTKKLSDYYRRLGFVRMRGTPFMVRASAWILPSI
jgi:GNAT superfamily N-acetyltransferase